MTADEKADKIILGMIAGTAALATMPPVLDVALYAAAVGGSVIAIGACYGIRISKGEATRLVMEFLSFAGFAFGGGKLISGILKATGLGYAAGGAIDAILYSTMSYAVGVTAKTYFKGERNPENLKRVFYAAKKAAPKHT